MKLTKLEQIVLNNIQETCNDDYCAEVKIIAKDLNMKVNSVKGVVGSLSKKNMIACLEDEDNTGNIFQAIFFLNENKDMVSYGDNLSY